MLLMSLSSLMSGLLICSDAWIAYDDGSITGRRKTVR